jgi:hypothetical protein
VRDEENMKKNGEKRKENKNYHIVSLYDANAATTTMRWFANAHPFSSRSKLTRSFPPEMIEIY